MIELIEFIQVTAQYSNAVLVAILPFISEFLKKAELPVPTPITQEHISEFRCWPVKGDVGGVVVLTNGLWIWYHYGYVKGFRTPRSYYNLQDPEDIPRFYGAMNLNKDEALQLARYYIQKLGYSLKETFADQEPEIDLPPQIGTNIVPHYRFQWKDPVFGGTAVKVEVDAGTKTIQEMQFSSPFFRRASPRIPVEPKFRNPRPEVSLSRSNELVAATLPKLSAFANKLDLPVTLPLAPEQIERVVFSFDWEIRIKLTNALWFVAQNGVITEFNTADSVYGRQPANLEPLPRPLKEYVGEWNMGEQQALELVRQSIRKLGYTVEEFYADTQPNVTKPEPVGQYIVPRYYFRWMANHPDTDGTIAMVRAEVDADKKRLKYLQMLSERLPGEIESVVGQSENPASRPKAPMILPMIFDTNAGAPFSAEELEKLLGGVSPATKVRTNDLRKPRPLLKPPNPYE